MTPRKKVMFANTTGKPLVQIREINIEGKGKKLVPAKRKQVPANLSKIIKKHETAVIRAKKNFDESVRKMENLKRQLNLEKNDENAIRNEMAKQMKKKSLFGKKHNVEHLKNRLEESNKEKKKIMQKMMKARINLNISKEKLIAQKAARV